jgi:1-acyl-sn-glycerol-3-phosphate acyltransferase
VKAFRILRRFLILTLYTTSIVAEILLRKMLYGADIHDAMRVRKRWARNLLRWVGVRMETEGEIPDFPCLIVSNHRSYLDPILMLCDIDGYPVAKAELASWPVLGKGAMYSGILYLRRESSGSRVSIIRAMEEKVKEGFPVIIFPEGTTSGLTGTLPFKKGVFQLAAKADIPVVPVALVFASEADYWVGTEGFLSHAGRRFKEKHIHVKVCYGPALRSDQPDLLLNEARAWIETRICS